MKPHRLIHWMKFSVLSLIAVAGLRSGPPARAEETPAAFAAQATEVMDYLQEHFYDRRRGLYATARDNPRPDYIWGCGVMFSALVGASRHDPRYEPVMRKFFTAMDAYWDTKVKIPGYEPAPTSGRGNDKYYDDNAWMVLTFLEAHELTGEKRYLDRATATLEFVVSGWDDAAGGGIWWHQEHKDDTKNTCANGPAAVGCFRLAKFDRKKAADWIKQGAAIVEWTTKTLQAPNGLFSDSLKVSTGHLNKDQLTYNAGLMLRAYLGWHAATGEARYLEEAKRIGLAALSLFDPPTGAYRDAIKWSHLMVEADLELYRWTGDETFRQRAVTDTAHRFAAWKKDPPKDLLANASLARQLWLLADHETETGRAFWKKSDRFDSSPSR